MKKLFLGNIKGPKGDDAGFAEPTAEASALPSGSAPTVHVTASGESTQKLFHFEFGVPQGEAGSQGPTGKDGGAAVKNPNDADILEEGQLGYKYGVLKIGDGMTAWKDLPSIVMSRLTFDTASWEDIDRIAAAGEANKYFHVGDEKKIWVSDYKSLTFVILGFDHDDLASGGKAPMTVGLKNCWDIPYSMNESATNLGGWGESYMKRIVIPSLISARGLPSNLKNVMKQVTKKTLAGNSSSELATTTDTMFLLSRTEITGEGTEGVQYEYWRMIKDGTIAANRVKYRDDGHGTEHKWWVRTPVSTDAFGIFTKQGQASSAQANSGADVSFAFCI